MGLGKQVRLFGLYLSQGAPYGFQSTVVPLLFRQWGKSYDSNAMAHLAFLPWAMKPLVAPFLENASLSSVSATLAVSGIIQLLMYHALLQRSSEKIIGLLLVSNIFTALYDILVDKLAIKQREESELDYANVFQVVGYKIGSLLSGALTLYTVAHYYNGTSVGYAMSPIISAGILLAMSLWTYIASAKATLGTRAVESAAEKPQFQAYQAIWKHFLQHKAVYALIFTYKAGETIGDTLFRTFLRDSGFDMKLLSTSNMVNEVVSIAGSMTMLNRPKQTRSTTGDMRQLRWYLLLNIVPQCLRAFIVCNKSAQQLLPVACITLIENFIGGAVTVACFNFMFSNVLPSVEGTHYAVYSSLEALGKILTGTAANLAVSAVGFPSTFLSAIVLSTLPVLLCSLKSLREGPQTCENTEKIF